MRAIFVVALACAPVLACFAPLQSGDGATGHALAATQRCPRPETGPRKRWRRGARSAAAASLAGAQHHSTNDPILNPGGVARVRAKFAYGAVSKDLEGEPVGLWLRSRPCGDWKKISTAVTDDDGRLTIDLPAGYFSGPGAYPYQLIVEGDLSRAGGTIYVLDPGTAVVIFDVDGTLTTGDGEIVEQVALGTDPEVRQGASQVVDYFARAQILPIYVTGRPYPLRRSTQSWLRRHGFAPGPLVTTDRITDASPSAEGVGRFKSAEIATLTRDVGLRIVAAYGNADTDVCVYSEAGVAPDRTFIVGTTAKQCRSFPPVQPLPSYVEHYRALAGQ